MRPARKRNGFSALLRALRDDESGAAILEFALLVPILVILVYGCFEVGRAIFVRQVMEGAVRAGARVLARVPDPFCEPFCSLGATHAVRMTVTQIVDNTGLAPDTMTVEPQRDPPAGTVAMEASIAFDVVFPGPVAFKRWTLRARHQEARIGE